MGLRTPIIASYINNFFFARAYTLDLTRDRCSAHTFSLVVDHCTGWLFPHFHRPLNPLLRSCHRQEPYNSVFIFSHTPLDYYWSVQQQHVHSVHYQCSGFKHFAVLSLNSCTYIKQTTRHFLPSFPLILHLFTLLVYLCLIQFHIIVKFGSFRACLCHPSLFFVCTGRDLKHSAIFFSLTCLRSTFPSSPWNITGPFPLDHWLQLNLSERCCGIHSFWFCHQPPSHRLSCKLAYSSMLFNYLHFKCRECNRFNSLWIASLHFPGAKLVITSGTLIMNTWFSSYGFLQYHVRFLSQQTRHQCYHPKMCLHLNTTLEKSWYPNPCLVYFFL